MLSIIQFSAEFGGQDAADAVLPHFKALKSAERGITCEGFPFPKLAFILRVDGMVHCFGQSGAGNLDVDRDGEYLSVDIGILRDDRERLVEAISDGIFSSIALIRGLAKSESWRIDFDALAECLRKLCARYRDSFEH